ncbi:lipoprotein [Actinocorallia lasiicapitis]
MPKRKTLAAAALGAALLLPLSACSSGGTTDGGSGNGGSIVENLKLTAAEMILKSSEKTANTDTFKATMVLDSDAMKMTASIQTQLKPSLLMGMEYTDVKVGDIPGLPAGADTSQSANMFKDLKAVVDEKAFYIHMPSLSQLTGGKPWLKMETGGKDDLGLGSVLKQAQQYSPAEQTKMMTSSPDVQQVGEEQVGGVKTVHYKGTMTLDTALAKLDPQAQKDLKELQSAAGAGTISFDIWIGADDQLPYKMISKTDSAVGAITSTMVYSDYGKPVTITVPPADQVGDFKIPS